MTMRPEAKAAAGHEKWSPTFLDYVFLAFNTGTAFSSTDAPALARWGKALMMIQSMISLTVILLAVGAVDIL
jgi:lipoprotein signal peptidase